ncbi:MAG: arginine repressor [Coxiellaceae bacterium]|nr:MAG: arginine repressor [Coxiellaceae bacterium]
MIVRDQSSLLLNTLRELLTAKVVHTQADIQAALRERGITANQSKISRCLHKLGAVKTKNETGQVVYQLLKEPAPIPTSPTLTQLITDIVHNEMMIIIHTSPGSASLIARILDHQQQKLGILGTVAGDDTIIVIPASIKTLRQTLNSIKSSLHLHLP